MRQIAKLLLSAGVLAAFVSSAPYAVQARGDAQGDLNQLVQEGIVSPDQASQIANRGDGGYGGWGGINFNPNFGFIPGQPSHYDTNMINRVSAQVRHLEGAGMINSQEKYALDRQLEARVHMVNDNPGYAQGAMVNGYNNGYNNGMNPYHNGMNQFQGQNQWHNMHTSRFANMYGPSHRTW